MGKTRDLFKKIGGIKGIFHARNGTTKDRNSKDLTEAEVIKKRWQEYTEKPYKKGLHDPDNHHSMVTHLEPDILECDVKWALGSITTNNVSGGDGIPCSSFFFLYSLSCVRFFVIPWTVQSTEFSRPEYWSG